MTLTELIIVGVVNFETMYASSGHLLLLIDGIYNHFLVDKI